MIWFSISIVLLAGAMLPLQAGVNAQLARNSGHALWASGASFLVGSLVLIALYAGLKQPWPGVTQLKEAPIWAWSGGLMGAFFVSSMVIFAPKLGATTLLALVIAGQMSAALVIDHYGMIGFNSHQISLWRLAGVLLIAAGVVLVRKF
ncbi:MAG: DMT family transporter [Motiliproteus sp.]